MATNGYPSSFIVQQYGLAGTRSVCVAVDVEACGQSALINFWRICSASIVCLSFGCAKTKAASCDNKRRASMLTCSRLCDAKKTALNVDTVREQYQRPHFAGKSNAD